MHKLNICPLIYIALFVLSNGDLPGLRNPCSDSSLGCICLPGVDLSYTLSRRLDC